MKRKSFKVNVQKADKMLKASQKGKVFLTEEGKRLLSGYLVVEKK